MPRDDLSAHLRLDLNALERGATADFVEVKRHILSRDLRDENRPGRRRWRRRVPAATGEREKQHDQKSMTAEIGKADVHRLLPAAPFVTAGRRARFLLAAITFRSARWTAESAATVSAFSRILPEPSCRSANQRLEYQRSIRGEARARWKKSDREWPSSCAADGPSCSGGRLTDSLRLIQPSLCRRSRIPASVGSSMPTRAASSRCVSACLRAGQMGQRRPFALGETERPEALVELVPPGAGGAVEQMADFFDVELVSEPFVSMLTNPLFAEMSTRRTSRSGAG